MSETLKFLLAFPIIIGLVVFGAVGWGCLVADIIRALKNKQEFFLAPGKTGNSNAAALEGK